MTPDQESRLHIELSKLHANLELVRNETRGTRDHVEMLRRELDAHRSETRRGQADTNTRLSSLEEKTGRYARRVNAIEQKLDHKPDNRDITGSHNVAELNAALARARMDSLEEAERLRRSESIWGKRQIKLWIVAAIGGLCVMALGGAGTVIFYLVTHR